MTAAAATPALDDTTRAQLIADPARILAARDLMRALVERDVVLEVCPTSNVATRCVESIDAHPLPALVAAGVAETFRRTIAHIEAGLATASSPA